MTTDKRFQVQTCQFLSNPSLAIKYHQSSPDAIPVVFMGSKTSKTTIGRGHDATVQIGKSNKRVSREHVVIEHKPNFNGYELTILSPNGALIDHIIFIEGEHVPVMEGTMIEIVGTRLIFKAPKEETMVIKQTMEKRVQKKGHCLSNEIETAVCHESNLLVKTTTKVKKRTLEDQIIQTLVYTRKSTMTCSDIANRIEGHARIDIINTLIHSPLIGCIKRLGKTADGSPKEDLYYYKADVDQNQERRKRYSDIGRSARKCTMKDTQYYFKASIPPKLNHHKSKHTVSMRSKKKAEINQRQDEDEVGSNSSGDVSDMEVYELFKDV
ncbi:uncharacterized protein B0P05DRAFT_592446 [Gilbertella persicaria]|nr:uncharacterized protein B0P05DRAFT_592446 [Gilbertella persicaria]KAI8047970.1 hypothetical protein B0P05DRAFT_592446 [Gilbertella persicaria]